MCDALRMCKCASVQWVIWLVVRTEVGEGMLNRNSSFEQGSHDVTAFGGFETEMVTVGSINQLEVVCLWVNQLSLELCIYVG